jgi:RNA polymerase sigma factor (sigma-70 family)
MVLHRNDREKVTAGGAEYKKALELFFKNYGHICKIIKYNTYLDFDDVLNFVFHELSKNSFARIRAYTGERGCTFKTFIRTVVTRLIINYADRTKRHEEKIAKAGDNIFDQKVSLPPEIFLELEETELKNKAVALLPGILKTLDKNEHRAVKLRYFKGLKTSRISKALNLSRFKVKRLLENAQYNIKRQLEELLGKKKNPGGNGGIKKNIKKNILLFLFFGSNIINYVWRGE